MKRLLFSQPSHTIASLLTMIEKTARLIPIFTRLEMVVIALILIVLLLIALPERHDAHSHSVRHTTAAR